MYAARLERAFQIIKEVGFAQVAPTRHSGRNIVSGTPACDHVGDTSLCQHRGYVGSRLGAHIDVQHCRIERSPSLKEVHSLCDGACMHRRMPERLQRHHDAISYFWRVLDEQDAHWSNHETVAESLLTRL